MYLVSRLCVQYDITLNMSQPSRIDPNLSAYNQLKKFDFNTTLLAPLETRVLIHEK